MPETMIPAETAALVESLNGAAPGEQVEVTVSVTKNEDGSFVVSSIDGTPVSEPMEDEGEVMLPEEEAMAGEAMEEEGEAMEDEAEDEMEEESDEPFAQKFSDYQAQVRAERERMGGQ